jgi:hypothetical protein
MPILAQSLGFNATTAATDIMPLPTTGGCSSWDLIWQYTETESGTTIQGENMAGMIDKVLIRDGSDAQAVFHIETNEAVKVAQWLGSRANVQEVQNAGSATGHGTDTGHLHFDNMSVSGKATYGFFRFYQKINFDSLTNPVIEIQLNPIQEITTLSAFSATFKFAYTPSAVNQTEYVSRTFTASETRSEIDLGEYPVIDIMWATGDTAVANTEATTLMGADGNNDIDANEPLEMMHYAANYQAVAAGGTINHVDTATDVLTFTSGPILSEPHSKRKLITRSATAAVMTVHYVSLARIVEHDEARSKAGPAARFGQKRVRNVLKPGRGSKVAKLPAKRLGRVLKGRGFRGL